MKTEQRCREIDIQDQVSEKYEAERYRAPHSRRYHIWWVDDMIAATPDHGLWLDPGRGTGGIHEVLRMRGNRRRLIGIDISLGMLRYAQRKKMTVLRGDAAKLPFADNCFNGVLAKGVLHHIPDMAVVVEEIARVLKPGGIAVLAEPNLSPLRALKYVLRNRKEHFSSLHRALRPVVCCQTVATFMQIINFRYFGLFSYAAAFPDILPLTLTERRMEALIRLDERLSRLPLLNRFCWAFKLSARKKWTMNRDGNPPGA
ncbi:MAG: class I SAM-dependent methyltransferase [Desulfosarcina sp.]|nr:class I SAM-dependent methyltransferase [Desulfobacterales bacterium]